MRTRLRDRWRQYVGDATDKHRVTASNLTRAARPGVITCSVYADGRRVDDDVEFHGVAARCHEGFVWIELSELNSRA